jgi:hypothetical protein
MLQYAHTKLNQEAKMYREEERGLGIWFKDGIENILLAIDEANLDMVSHFDAPEVRIYRQGFAAAISAAATAFGIRYASPRTTPTQTAHVLDLPVQEWREG